MARQWTFGQRVAVGFAITISLSVATGVVGVIALRNVVSSKDRVITVDAPQLIDAERLRTAVERKGSAGRGFLLTGADRFVNSTREARNDFTTTLAAIRGRGSSAAAQAVDAIEQIERAHEEAFERVFALRRAGTPAEQVGTAFEEQVIPKRDQLSAAIRDFIAGEARRLEEARAESSDSAATATTLVGGIALASVLLGALLAFVIARRLSQQIAGAVSQVQSSSAELQAAANQQATGAREQATAMSEITTTISELLATSRQIAESAQRVAQIANQTATSARTGDGTVNTAHESITSIRRQVDLVVNHMLALGKKSQEIGAVLEIVAELAEQTNILAINATIEAAGAGDAGKRFGVVADEIRKLADRVAASTKEIRTLIDDVRGAVNTTVMATETGSKSVDTGSRQFADVASAFKHIAGLVTTTTEAAREIELSTKQQATAVEQVNVAIANVAQATKETEASSGQTLMTASQLASLSQDLLQLVQPQQ